MANLEYKSAHKRSNFEYKVVAADLCEVKATNDAGSGFVEGYASVFGNVDLGKDVVQPGAFNKTLKEGLPSKAIKFVDSHKVFEEGTGAIIGLVEEASEDSKGLRFKARFSQVGRAQDVRIKIQEGILNAVSFGYRVIKDAAGVINGEPVRFLKELSLYEVSIVPWGMNPLADITGVKAITGVQSFPTAPEDLAWDAAAAKTRLQNYVSSDDADDADSPDKSTADWDTEDWNEYASFFLWVAGKGSTRLADYKFPVCDVVDGEPKYVLKAAQSAFAALSKGTASADWYKDRSKIQNTINAIYKKFGKDAPAKSYVFDAEGKDYYSNSYYDSGSSSLANTDPALHGMFSDFQSNLAGAAEKMKHVRTLAEQHGVLNTDYTNSGKDNKPDKIEQKAVLASHAKLLGDQATAHLAAAGKHLGQIVAHLSTRKGDDGDDAVYKALFETLTSITGRAEDGAAMEPELKNFHSLLGDMQKHIQGAA